MRKKNRPRWTGYFLTGLLFLLLCPLPGIAGGKGQWADMMKTFQKASRSNQIPTRTKAAQDLVDAMYPKVEKKAAQMLVDLLSQELKRGGRREERVAFTVLDTCVNGLKKITDEKALEFLLKRVNSRSQSWRLRFYIIKGLSGINTPEVVNKLAELLDEKNEKIQIAALDGLANLKSPTAAERACQLLNAEVTWEIKIAATNYLKELNNEDMIEPLINALLGRNLEGRARSETVDVLKQLTGEDYGLRGSAWSEWWSKKKRGEDVSAAGDKGPETTTAVYYGVEVTSTRIVFILDISGSMQKPINWTDTAPKNQLKPVLSGKNGKAPNPKVVTELIAKKNEIDSQPVKTRMDGAKRELVNAIYNLAPSVNFTIIFYSIGTTIWQESLVPAHVNNKMSAIEEIQAQAANGSTSTYDALELAYRLAEKGKGKKKVVQINKKGDYVNETGGADTIFLVSDGLPNTGKIGQPDAIVNAIKKINQTRKIKINTIIIGGDAENVKFMRNLAEATNGAFVNKSR